MGALRKEEYVLMRALTSEAQQRIALASQQNDKPIFRTSLKTN
jgi:hypothetical protein